MLKSCFWSLALAGASLVSTGKAAGFADTVIAYNPGTGFSAGFTNASASLGAPTATATPFSPAFQNSQIVSLGAGGSLTVQLGTPVQNDPSHPFGMDFTVFGNTGFIVTNGNFSGGGITSGAMFGNNTGVTHVWVSSDNINYFELNPVLAPTVDGLFPTDSTGNFNLPVNPALLPGSFNGLTLAGIRALYNGSAGGSSYDISWAQDSQGNAVALSSIDYIRVEVLSGKSEVDGFALVAAPEPSSWAFLAGGLLVIGWLRKRGFKLETAPKLQRQPISRQNA
jgi:hypothetical protein